MAFHVAQFDFTQYTSDKYNIEFWILENEPDSNSPESHSLVEALGTFGSLESARKCIIDAAGTLGVRLVEDMTGDVQEDIIEVYALGNDSVLTAAGTLKRYAEWAYEECVLASDDDVEALATREAEESIANWSPVPDKEALVDMLKRYRDARNED